MKKKMTKTDEILELDQENVCDDLFKELIQSGVDLRNYSHDVNRQLKRVENSCVGDYINESTNIARLHQQINESDQILERIEGMLCAFQADLGNICQEILTLQEQSVALNVKLKNKQAVRGDLTKFIDDLIIPQSVITHILDTPAQEREFLEQLQVLDAKICFVREQTFKDARSCEDVLEILNNLKIRAINKIYEYVMRKIQSIKKPMSNYQIPQTALMQKSFFFRFLFKHNRDVAKEIQYEYTDTLSKVFFSYFKDYLHRLNKLRFDEQPDKEDLMAADDSIKSKTSFFTGKQTLKNRSTIFTLGDRGDILTKHLEVDMIVPHLVAKTETKYPIEAIFRSHQFTLVDHACREYCFISNFFYSKPAAVQDVFSSVFARAIQLILKQVEEEFSVSYDCIGLFLCLHIVYRFRLICHKRAVPALDGYWESLVDILWTRFEHLIRLQIESLKNCDIYKIENCDTRPHFITRRYAEFSAAIHTTNATYPDERVSIHLAALHTEIENLILKLASKFSTPKEQLVFLINNNDIILSVLLEKAKEESKESESIKQQINKRVHDFVEELLYPFFGSMISFVKDCEAYLDKQDQAALKKEENKILPIIKSFNNGWRKAIEEINKDVMISFTNFNCGNEIKMSALTEMVHYYHRFHQLVSQEPFKNNPARSSLMNIHQLMIEIKKYKN